MQNKLPDHPNHPKGRNPYAHVASCIKSRFNKSYKDIDDEKIDEVIEYIERTRAGFAYRKSLIGEGVVHVN